LEKFLALSRAAVVNDEDLKPLGRQLFAKLCEGPVRVIRGHDYQCHKNSKNLYNDKKSGQSITTSVNLSAQ
ncbi:MAG TPA: hypothetical protein PKW98_20885, partial [Candidatus Wallbacteria bacterium]|nr:hypothetical protein [Candidatus Wallbacteria bacterium]